MVKLLILLFAIIGLAIISDFIFYTIKYNTKENSSLKYISFILFIFLFLYFFIKEDNTAVQVVSAVGVFANISSMVGWFKEDKKYKSCAQLMRLNKFHLIVSYCIEKKGEEHTKKINMIFEVLSDSHSHGTIMLLDDKGESTILLFIKNIDTDQISKINEVCEMVGEYEFYGENNNRCSMSCKMK